MELNNKFYNIDRENLLKTKSKEKRLSSNILKYEYKNEIFYEVAHKHIVKTFYSFFNFISKEITPNLIISPETSLSYSAYNENKIQIGTLLLYNKEIEQQKKVDSIIAVIIHELWHKKYTNKDIMNKYNINIKDFYELNESKKIIKNLLPNKIIADIFNILEDRRIERLGLNDSPGFVFYFDSLREICYSIHKNKKIGIYLLSSLIMEYIMFKILIPELIDFYMEYINEVYKNLKTKPKFKKEDIINLINSIDKYILINEKRVYSDSIFDLFIVSKEIYNLIPNDIKKDIESELNSSDKQYNGIYSDYIYENEKQNEIIIENDKKNIINLINSEIKENDKKNISINNDSEQLTKTRIEKINIKSENKNLYENVIIINQKCNIIDNVIYNKAKKISSNITRNLGFISSRLNQINETFELNEGEIDESELFSISFNNSIFYEEEQKKGFSLDFGILIDESGSMRGVRKENAIIAALSCILSTKDSNHVNLFVYGHSQGRHSYPDKYIELYEYYNNKRNINNWKNIFAVGANGSNADGYAIAKMGEIMLLDSNSKNKIMVVISDGLPCAPGYGNEKAQIHVKSIVNILESKGIEIIQICINNIEDSNKMFNNFIPFDSIGNFMKKFSEILQKKLIKFSDNL